MLKRLFFIKNHYLLGIFFTFHMAAQDYKEVVSLIEKDTIIETNSVLFTDTTSINLRYFEENFDQKYKSADFDYSEQKSNTQQQNYYQKFLRWLQRFLGGNEEKTFSILNTVFKVIFVGLLLVIAYFIYKSFNKNKGILQANTKKLHNDYTEITTQFQHTDFTNAITHAIKNNDKRLAIRLYYLWLLKKMADNHIIVLDEEKTNSDYYYEIKKESLKSEFSYLCYLYEHIWYGAFEVDDHQFEVSVKTFQKTIESVY